MTVYRDFETAKQADPQKKGVGLYTVYRPGDSGRCHVWTRTKRDAIAAVAIYLGDIASKYHPGATVENGIEAPAIQEDLF